MTAVVLFSLLLTAASFAMPQAGEEVKGKDVFQRRCGGCHMLDRPLEGPGLRGVYGRRAGSRQPGFQYSRMRSGTPGSHGTKVPWTNGSQTTGVGGAR